MRLFYLIIMCAYLLKVKSMMVAFIRSVLTSCER